ncbi:MAG: AAA family ATPase, partial [Gammaproteobacteria bacterium HGW-Gammaproteobacteria-8]
LASISPSSHAATAARLSRYPVSPGVIAQCIRTARLGGGGEAVIERSVQLLGKAVSGITMPAVPSGEDFLDTDLINCDDDLRGIARTLAKNPVVRASICIHGPPGTGKSLWVRHLAEQLGMEVLQRRASDLLSRWLGGTEQNIASSFSEAIDQRALLVFDEVDSLLRDRAQAVYGWQISQVNEMLTWMECHPLPFACTTNLPETLDRAALRRFDLKLKFDYLRPEQARSAFRRFFGMAPPAGRLLPGPLTPADFVVVARRRGLAGITDARGLVELLDEECRHRACPQRPIGFIHAEGA